MFYDLICINNNVFLCLISMLSTRCQPCHTGLDVGPTQLLSPTLPSLHLEDPSYLALPLAPTFCSFCLFRHAILMQLVEFFYQIIDPCFIIRHIDSTLDLHEFIHEFT